MKIHQFILTALLCTAMSSCLPPLASRALGLPAKLISTVVGPVLGGLGL